MSVTGDPATDAMVAPAMNLIWAVRENDGARVSEAFQQAAQHTGGDMYRAAAGLALTLAAMVPDDRTASELLAWTQMPRSEYLALRAEGYGCDEATFRATPVPRPPAPAESSEPLARVVPIRRGR